MKQQVNLYTAELRPRQQRLTAGAALALVAVFLLMILGIAGYGEWQSRQLAERVVNMEQRNAGLQASVQQLSEQVDARQPDPELQAALKRVADTLSRRQRLLDRVETLANDNHSGFSGRLAALARQVPEDLWLTSISLESAPHSLSLRGRTYAAKRVPDYLQRLGEEPVFAGETFRDFRLRRPGDEEPSAEWVGFHLSTTPAGEGRDD
ncbi:PilN domain-containing protein [Marinobacter oulmenensis]|uniref:MSHA biogenesis protein MshI n=1 Tax=Marinobacter oulmenensis TaxID=643747 RepID=A0A840UFL4_9GAMM|nr:PilN domain-containing protein [Marinobacter oulmenensis]MBB5322270.1 MSHA biogenesis protein MshI [Marinobacter oulmenensis]